MTDSKVKAGAALLVAAIVVSIWQFGVRSANGFACEIAGPAVGLIVEGATRGRSSGSIISSVLATIGTSAACEATLAALLENPGEEVDLTITTPAGSTTETVRLEDLIGGGAPTTSGCMDWQFSTLQTACLNGAIGPPGAAAAATAPVCSDWLTDFLRDMCTQGVIGPPEVTLADE